MKRLRPLTAAGLSLLFSAVVAQAANITSLQSGNWDVGTTWVGGIPPVAGDNVTIASSHAITVAVDAAAATVTVAANIIGTNGITINSGILLNVSGAITMTAPTAAATSTISVGAGTLQAASIAIPGSATAGRTCDVTVSTGTITTTGSITFSGTAAQARFTSTGASTVRVGGSFGGGGTLTTTGTGTFEFNGGGAQTVGAYTTYNNVTINNSSGGVTFTGTTTVGGTLTVTTGTLTVGAFVLTISGSTYVSGTLSIASTTGAKTFTGDVIIQSGGTWNNTVNDAISMGGSLQNDGTYSAGTGVQTFSGISKTVSGANPVTIPRLTVTSPGTVTNNGTLTVSTVLAGTGSLTNAANSTLNISGTSTINTLIATANPNTVNYDGNGAQTIKMTTYHNLTVTSTGGTVTANGDTVNNNFTVVSGTVSSGTTLTTVSGNLSINGGSFSTNKLTVLGTTSVSGTMSIAGGAAQVVTLVGAVTVNTGGVWNGSDNATLQGGLTHNGTTFNGTGTYTFDTNNQTIGGASAITMGGVTVTGVTLANNSTVGLAVTIALSGTGGLTQGTGATLNLGGTSGITTLTATANPNTVNYTSNGNQTVKPVTYHHLTLSGTTNTKTLTNVGTINGDLTLSGTCNATTAIATTVGGNLTVGSGTTFTAAGFDLTVTGTTGVSGTLARSSATGAKTHIGLVTINAGGAWTNAGNSSFTFRGGLTHNGTTFTAGTGVYTFDANSQAVGGSSTLTIGNVTVTGVVLTNNSTTFTISTALSGTGECFQGTGATLNIGGTSGITSLTATANPNTVNYSGAAQVVKAATYHHLTLSGSGAKTMPSSTTSIAGNLTMSGTCSAIAAAVINTAGNVTVGSTNTFTTGSFTHDLKGNFTNQGTFTATGSTITLTGTADQSIGGSATTTFNHLSLNKASGTVTVSTTFNVGGVLTFTGGNISTGANVVVITSTGSVSRTSGHVIGNLRKNVATGSNVSRTFEIGDASNYTPVDVAFASVSVTGNFTLFTTAGDHSNIATSDVYPSKSANRYWTLTNNGVTFTNYSATFNFSSGDVDAGANTATFEARRFSGGSWFGTTGGPPTATSTQITGETGTGDFQVGNVRSVAVSNSAFAFGTQLLNSWLAAQSSVITNDGVDAELIVAQISTFTAGANTWALSSVSNGADQVRAQWSTTSDTGPWTDISTYASNFTISANLAANSSVTLYFRIQSPTSTSSNNQYSSSLTVTAQ